MGGPLDDAIRKHEAKEATRRSIQEHQDAADAVQREKFNALVTDFLSRMKQRRFPNTTVTETRKGKFGLQQRLKCWRLDYTAFESLTLATNGLIKKIAYRDEVTEFVSAAEINKVFNDEELDELGESMAKALA